MTRNFVVILIGLWAAPLLAQEPVAPQTTQNKGAKYPDCYCTDKAGARVELGEMRCLFVDGRSFTAQCQMSLNNPMWREVGPDCLSSSLPRSGNSS